MRVQLVRSTQLEELADRALDIIFRYRLRPTRGFDYVSAAATRVTGYTPEEHYANPDLGFKLVPPERPQRPRRSHGGAELGAGRPPLGPQGRDHLRRTSPA